MGHHASSAPASGDHYEKSDINVTWLVIGTVVCTLAVVASAILCNFYFDYYKAKLHQEMVVDRGFRLSNKAKAAGAEVLSTENATGEKKQIPIDKAMEIITKEAAK